MLVTGFFMHVLMFVVVSEARMTVVVVDMATGINRLVMSILKIMLYKNNKRD